MLSERLRTSISQFTLSKIKTKAEMGGFEPPIPYGMPVFETGAFNHSATSPYF